MPAVRRQRPTRPHFGTLRRPRAGLQARSGRFTRPWAAEDAEVGVSRGWVGGGSARTARLATGGRYRWSLPAGAVGGAVFVVVGQHQIPAVAAVFAAVGNDVAGQPDAVLGGMREQVATAPAIDAGDGGFRLQHARSLAGMEAVTACE